MTDPERIRYPLRRVGPRGGGRWERVTWDEVLDDIGGRIRKALVEGRQREVMYHLGRPGHELVYLQRVFHAWGIDGHNSHTNVCSASARAGYAFWHGMDRPSPDHANARFILLLSSHLETGHYFNPHAQRIMEAKARGAKIAVFDTRLSNTASMADWWLAPWPGSESAVLLAMAHILVREKLYDREFVRRWMNWDEYLREERPDLPVAFESFERAIDELYARFTPEYAEAESGVSAASIVEVAREIGRAGSALATHIWRNTAAGNLGGWQVARALELIVVLMGAVGTPGGTAPSAWNKAVPAPPMMPPPGKIWSELLMPREYPLAFFEMSFLLPHFLREGRGKLAMYFTRVYNPVWTNPDGMSWIEALTDETKVERHACLTPIWSETAWFADFVLPMGHASERHDLMSQETHAARWIGFRQPVLRVALEKAGKRFDLTWQAHEAAGIGQVWEEDEFWIELSWRIDPDGSLGIRKYFESPYRPGEKLRIEEQYRWMFENSVPGLAGGRREGEADAARVYAQVRRVPDRGRCLSNPRASAGAKDLDGATVDPVDQGRHEGWSGGRRGNRRPASHRIPHALAQARVLLQDVEVVEVAGAGGAELHPEPRPLVEPRPREWRDGAATDVPAADLDPHAVGQREVALRDLPHEPALAPSGRRDAARRRDRGSPEDRHADRSLRRQGVGDRVRPSRRGGLLAPPGPVAPARGRGRRAMVDVARRSEPARRRQMADAAAPRAAPVPERRSRTRHGSGGTRPASTRI